MEITASVVRELLNYDPKTGIFRWKVDRQRARAGETAGCICPMYGYTLIGLNYRHYRASRLAWLYMTGSWPGCLIDHIDRDRSNDAWSNLRQATFKQNNENRQLSSKSLSGVKGVAWQPSRKKWMAHITHNGKTINLGRYPDINAAIAARNQAEARYFTHAGAG